MAVRRRTRAVFWTRNYGRWDYGRIIRDVRGRREYCKRFGARPNRFNSDDVRRVQRRANNSILFDYPRPFVFPRATEMAETRDTFSISAR